MSETTGSRRARRAVTKAIAALSIAVALPMVGAQAAGAQAGAPARAEHLHPTQPDHLHPWILHPHHLFPTWRRSTCTPSTSTGRLRPWYVNREG